MSEVTQPVLRDPFCWHCGRIVQDAYLLYRDRPFCNAACLRGFQELDARAQEEQ
jgi:hypothetical protein